MKVNQTSKFILTTLVALFTLTSCNKYVAERNKEIETTLAVAEEKLDEARIPDTPLITDTVFAKNDIWLGNSSIKITEGDPLPSWAEKQNGITLVISEESTLPLLAQEITELTGITVRLDDLKAEKAIPSETVPVNYSGKLSGLLNYMSNRFGVWWRYKGGVITFFTKETRVFTIYALPTETSLSADLKGASMGDQEGGASTSLSTKADLSLWNSIETGVKQALGKDGEVSFSRPTGTATVTASPHAMRKVADYINNWNEKMSRQVAISVKVLTVSISDTNTYGLDLTAAFANNTIGTQFLSPSSIGPMGAATSVAGGLSMAIIDPSSKWYGSNGIIEALSTQGKTSMVTSSSVTTLNNKVAPVQVTTSRNYVKETTVTTTGSGSDATTESEINTDTLNYGFSMDILPRILDHGRLIMLFSLSLTDLVELKNFTSSGSGSSGSSDSDSESGSGSNDDDDDDNESETTTVQLPTMRTRGFIQEIAMRSGSTLVLTGFEQIQSSTKTAGIGQPRLTILGGDAYDDKTRDVLVILVTPEVLESPLSPETRMQNF